jgi:hypothetical protein
LEELELSVKLFEGGEVDQQSFRVKGLVIEGAKWDPKGLVFP